MYANLEHYISLVLSVDNSTILLFTSDYSHPWHTVHNWYMASNKKFHGEAVWGPLPHKIHGKPMCAEAIISLVVLLKDE